MQVYKDVEFRQVRPEGVLGEFVDSFWMLHNRSGKEKAVIGLPDGRVDVFFSKSAGEPYHALVLGLNTQADEAVVAADTLMFAVSFKLLAVEYLLGFPIADLQNKAKVLPDDLWGLDAGILHDFDLFCSRVSQHLLSLLPHGLDQRKRQLFSLIYASKGEMTVADLSAQVFWSPRQINRYFDQQFGISLKAYCRILRFRASLEHIVQGRLFPELNFTDQNHFIKEVRKFSGTVPKELFRNQNDRFILLSAMRQL